LGLLGIIMIIIDGWMDGCLPSAIQDNINVTPLIGI